jgi:nitrogen fixation protein FixH
METKTGTSFNPWPISIITFFAVAIAGCVTFVTFCARHPADLISAHYYEDEVQYQGQMQRLHNAQEGGQRASVTYDSPSRQIRISVPKDQFESRPSGKVELYRPSSLHLDRQFKLDLNPLGTQTIAADTLLPGLWKVRVTWAVGEHDYFIDQPIVIPSHS